MNARAAMTLRLALLPAMFLVTGCILEAGDADTVDADGVEEPPEPTALAPRSLEARWIEPGAALDVIGATSFVVECPSPGAICKAACNGESGPEVPKGCPVPGCICP